MTTKKAIGIAVTMALFIGFLINLFILITLLQKPENNKLLKGKQDVCQTSLDESGCCILSNGVVSCLPSNN